MGQYLRPEVVERTFLDAKGAPIPYGHRWDASIGDEWPDLVNVFSDQDRFLPIFDVADALIRYLSEEFSVLIKDDLGHAAHFKRTNDMPVPAFRRVVRIEPDGSDQAPITLGFHDAPGSLSVTVGCFSEFDLWFCGCDACDDNWEDTADALEHVLLSVARGGLTERITRGPAGRARYWLDQDLPRDWSGSISKRVISADRLAQWRRTLASVPGGTWRGYVPRTHRGDTVPSV